MADYSELSEDAKLIVNALRAGLVYSKIGAAQLAWMELIEDYWKQGQLEKSDKACEELCRLTDNADVQETAQANVAYTSGIARMCRGIKVLRELSQGGANVASKLQVAADDFEWSQGRFRMAGVSHSEAVALLARGIVHQRQNQFKARYKPGQKWSDILADLERSLTIFRDLGDSLQFTVRKRLEGIRVLYEQDIDTESMGSPGSSLPPSNPPSPSPDSQSPSSGVGRGLRPPPTRTSHGLYLIPVTGPIAGGTPTPIDPDDNPAGYVQASEVTIDGKQYVAKSLKDRQEVRLNWSAYSYFVTPVKGDSMVNRDINSGDYVLLQKPRTGDVSPTSGDIVAAVIDGVDREATLKVFKRDGRLVRLVPENDALKPSEFPFPGPQPWYAGIAVAVMKLSEGSG